LFEKQLESIGKTGFFTILQCCKIYCFFIAAFLPTAASAAHPKAVSFSCSTRQVIPRCFGTTCSYSPPPAQRIVGVWKSFGAFKCCLNDHLLPFPLPW